MSDYYLIDAQGQTTPIACFPGGQLDLAAFDRFERCKKEHHKVARETHGDADVSTVFLGLDHQFDDGPPLLFETMIFGGKHDDYCERYATIEEARDGHRVACAVVRNCGCKGD